MIWGFGEVMTPVRRARRALGTYHNSKRYHARTGLQRNARTAEALGTVDVKRIGCACAKCKAPIYDFKNCLVKGIFGAPTKKDCRRITETAAVTNRRIPPLTSRSW